MSLFSLFAPRVASRCGQDSPWAMDARPFGAPITEPLAASHRRRAPAAKKAPGVGGGGGGSFTSLAGAGLLCHTAPVKQAGREESRVIVEREEAGMNVAGAWALGLCRSQARLRDKRQAGLRGVRRLCLQ